MRRIEMAKNVVVYWELKYIYGTMYLTSSNQKLFINDEQALSDIKLKWNSGYLSFQK